MSDVKDKATEVLLGLIQKASDGVDSAVAFSQAQIPDVISQLLLWNAVASGILCILGIALVVIPLITLYWLTRQLSNKAGWAHDKRYETTSNLWDGLFCSNLFIGGITIIAGVVIAAKNFDWLKIWLAPKLYLLEYAASLLK